jgi:uncharacterized membrane protein
MTGGEPDRDLRRDLADLRAQLRALEERLGAMEARIEAEASDAAESVEEPPASRGVSADLLERKRAAAAEHEATRPVASPPPLPERALEPRERKALQPTRPRWNASDLEWLVGTKGIVLAGVVILVIAAGLFLKEAWDRGWIDQVPGWVRCAIGAGFGLSLVGVGEAIRRRINPLASSGVSAAGLAIVFGSILAASRLYDLLTTPAAFVLLALTTFAGVFMGALSSRVLLAALSLAGAFVVPLVLATGEPSYVILPAYLLSLLVMGLALAGWKGNGYAIIRRIAWWGTALLGTMWGLATSETSAASPAVFAGLVWALTIAELVASARFFERLRPSVPWPELARAGFMQAGSDDPITLDVREMVSPEARWVNTSFGVSAWAAVLAGFAVHRHYEGWSWIVTAALLLASVLVAVLLSPTRPRLWGAESAPRSALSTAMVINAAGLLAATIALGLGGAAEVVAWALVGLAAVVFGWRMRFHASSVLGLGFIGFALGRVLTYDLGEALWALHEGTLASVKLLGVHFSGWSALLALVASTLVVAGVLLGRSPYRVAVAMVAVGAVGLTVIGPGNSVLSVGALWAIYGVAIAFLAVRVRRVDVRFASLVTLVAGAGLVHLRAYAMLVDAVPPRPDLLWIRWNDASWALSIVAASAIAWPLRRGQRPLMRALGVLVAVWSIAVAVLGDGLPMPTLLVVWSVLVAVVAACAFASHMVERGRLHRWMLAQIALVLSLALTTLWLGERAVTDWGDIEALAMLHRAMVSAVLLIALLLAIGWLVREALRVPMLPAGVREHQQEANRVLRIVGWSAAGVLAFVASSSEIVRLVHRSGIAGDAAPDAALSVWWSLFAVATIALGVRQRTPAIRWVGLGLLAITGAKVLLMDMAALDGLTRIAGSAVVGLVMLAAGVGYAWLMGKAGAESPESDAAKG